MSFASSASTVPRVTVTTKLVTESSVSREHKIDKSQHIEQLQHQNHSEDHSGVDAPAIEPGVVANVGVPDAPPAAAAAPVSSKETEELTNAVDHSAVDITTTRPGGSAPPASASVAVPQSYLRKFGTSGTRASRRRPTSVRSWSPQKADIRSSVMSAIALPGDAPVTVTSFVDFEEPAPADATRHPRWPRCPWASASA